MRKLALDFGIKTCGFAISDSNCIIAKGLENYYFTTKKFSEVIDKIKWYIYDSEYKNEIDEIILGYPLRMDLSKSERTIMVENFQKMLQREVDLKITFQDERQSTINAEEILKLANYSKTRRKTKKDSLAAQLILEDYLRKYYEK